MILRRKNSGNQRGFFKTARKAVPFSQDSVSSQTGFRGNRQILIKSPGKTRGLSACRKSQCHSEAAKRPWESVLLKVPVFLKVWLKAEHLGERIATPVCELARNDRFFDSLQRLPPGSLWFFMALPADLPGAGRPGSASPAQPPGRFSAGRREQRGIHTG